MIQMYLVKMAQEALKSFGDFANILVSAYKLNTGKSN